MAFKQMVVVIKVESKQMVVVEINKQMGMFNMRLSLVSHEPFLFT